MRTSLLKNKLAFFIYHCGSFFSWWNLFHGTVFHFAIPFVKKVITDYKNCTFYVIKKYSSNLMLKIIFKKIINLMAFLLAMMIIIYKLTIKRQILIIFGTALIFVSLKCFNFLKKRCPCVTKILASFIFKLLIVLIFEWNYHKVFRSFNIVSVQCFLG